MMAKFGQLLIDGTNPSEAYGLAGYAVKGVLPATVANNAYMLGQHSEIQAMVTEGTRAIQAAGLLTRGFAPKVLFPGHFWDNWFFCSKSLSAKYRFDPQFIDGLDENDDIMAQDFSQNFVDLGHWRLGTNGSAELGLDH